MVKVKNIEDILAEQAVRKVATCYSRGVDRTDLDLLNSAFHDDAEVRYGSYDGHYAEFTKMVVDGQADMDYTTHTVVNEYYDIDASSNKLEPHRIPTYLYELSSLFHSYWNLGKDNPNKRFINEQRKINNDKLIFLKVISNVIKSWMDIVGVSVPEKM